MKIKKYLLVMLVGSLTILLLFTHTQKLKAEIEQSTRKQIKQTILDKAIQCYSIEGAYPKDIDYLIKYYGLSINNDSYIIDYKIYGSNQLPEVRVVRR